MRIVLTRPRAQSEAFAARLRAQGLHPILFPTIEISPPADLTPLRESVERLERYDWLIFTSANAVEAFFALQPCFPEHLQIAVIGPKTAQALRERGGPEPQQIPEEYTSEALLPILQVSRNTRVLIPTSDRARPNLPQALRQAGAQVDVIVAYRTLPAQPDPLGLAELQRGVDWLTFTSPSTVENFILLLQATPLDALHLPGDPRLACIGPVTAEAARQAGFRQVHMAETYTVEGLIHLILSDREKESR